MPGNPRAGAIAARREFLRFLRTHECQPVSLAELAGGLVRSDYPWGDQERLMLRLHHVILPSLVAAGVVDYDPQARSITLRDRARTEELSALLPGWEATQ